MQPLGPDRRIGDRYVLLERIASGGHAAIWRAQDEDSDEVVALKILHPALAGSLEAWGVLQREHLMTQRLDHPGILGTEPPCRDGDVVMLPMEYASGGDLRRMRGQSYLRIVPVLIEIAAALSHAHENGVVHRDLKPGNVLFDDDGNVKLADFGAADFAGSTAALAAGSPFSASPQQLRNEPASPADDIYGLGALAYELLSGYPPYYPDFDLERVLREPPKKLEPVHATPARLCSLVESMLARDAAERPSSMAYIVEALYQSLSDTLELEESVPRPAPRFALTQTASDETRAFDGERSYDASRTVGLPPLDVEDFDAPERDASRSSPPFPTRVIPRPTPLPPLPPSPPSAPPPRPEPEPAPPPYTRTVAIPRRETQDESMVSVAPAAPQPQGERPPGPSRRLGMLKERTWRGWLAFVLLAALALGAILALPRLMNRVQDKATTAPAVVAQQPAADTPAPAKEAPPTITETASLQAREEFRAALAALEARQAGAWAGESFAAARSQGDAAQRELDAGRFDAAQSRFQAAAELLKPIAGSAENALRAELTRGNAAIGAGQLAAARQAYARAARIQPDNAAVRQGQQDIEALDKSLQIMSEGARAESNGKAPDALKLYEQAAQTAPQFRAAREARDRMRIALAQNDYERQVAIGFDALRSERFAEARSAFQRALTMRDDSEAARGGLAQVDTALAAQDFGALRQQAASYEAAERWEDAVTEYQHVLGMDPTLRFARQGRDRAERRASLSRQLDGFIAEPQRLATLEVHEEANGAIQRAQLSDPQGPVLRSQVARVQILLEEYEKPVRIALESDNSTQISIARVGSFGTFTRRDLELKPGRYTVIGTRAGFRDVRRDIQLAPGQSALTVSVQCTERI